MNGDLWVRAGERGRKPMQSLLAYWKPKTVDYEVGRGEKLNHSASEQFWRVNEGDHVWLVTVRDGGLSVIGRIIVGRVTDKAGAASLLGLGTDDLWKSNHHIVAAAGTAKPTRDVIIPGLAKSLRFVSRHNRLTVKDGRVNAQQLQTMRILTPGSAAELEAAFRCDVEQRGKR